MLGDKSLCANFQLDRIMEVGHFILLFFRGTTTDIQECAVNIRDLKTLRFVHKTGKIKWLKLTETI